MRISLLLLVASLALAGCATCSKEIMPEIQTPHSFQERLTKTVRANYLLYLPPDHRKHSTNRWPMILFLHGAGERGTDVRKVAVHGPPKIVKQKKGFPFVLVSPQCPAGQIWSNETLLGLLDEVTTKYQVDTNRIYLTGLSMGAFATWSLGLAHPEKFAALAPICGGGETITFIVADRSQTQALKALPVWAFHGAKDEVVKLEESQRMVSELKKLGNKEVELTVYPATGHDSWTRTYNNEKLYEWFLKHERRPVR